MTTWPLFDLDLTCREVSLHVVRDDEIATLAELQPDDFENDPAAVIFDGRDEAAERLRLFTQGVWRNRGTWSPTSWCLDFAVLVDGALVGLQSLEADSFPTLRTVDSGSWLTPGVRGRGLGVAMRTAVLGLAFDHLGAEAAVSSAVLDNAASLGVSHSIGYADNGLSFVRGPSGVETLQHVWLTRGDWQSARLGDQVTVTGFAGCEPWFGLPQGG
jgi:RimJ/RimL family protein N-acetyltransferase